jgi:hypothetical protein
MFLNTIPWCPNRLPGDEYTGESQLPCGEYTGESPLWCIYLEQASEQVYKKTFW